MAYSSTNPPQVLVPRMGNGVAVWAYKSTHTSTEAANSGFFANGEALGMKVGDIVLVVNSTSGVPYYTAVSSVSTAATVVPTTAT